MANKQLFASAKQPKLPLPDAANEEGSAAYRLSPKQALAQYAATGTLQATFYADAQTQLQTLLDLCREVEPRFIAKTALYCRERGYMKDTAALLLAVLAVRDQAYLPGVFKRVVNNGKMLRNFVQILRSGAVGRKSLGTRPKKLVQDWLNSASEQALLAAAIGTQPSLADVLKMVHPKPSEPWREAFFAWVIGKPFEHNVLPPVTRAYEDYKRELSGEIPAVPFQFLTALPLATPQWTAIALNAGWQMLRMNLNTFARHGIYADAEVVASLADKLRDPKAIAKAKVFPYQLLAAYKNARNIPEALREALQDALDIALANVPEMIGRVVVCPDVSGSMAAPVTGYRGTASTSVRCIDVAALVAAALMRKNPDTMVLPFENDVVKLDLNPRDPVLTNAQKLAAIGGGGTNCSAPLRQLNRDKVKADLVVFVSDNESWLDARRHGATAMMQEWAAFKRRNPNAKLVCIDIQPYGTTQAVEQVDILNIGGFSDAVFSLIATFAAGELHPDHWVGVIEEMML